MIEMSLLLILLAVIGSIVCANLRSRKKVGERRIDQVFERLSGIERAIENLIPRVTALESKVAGSATEKKAEVAPAAVAPTRPLEQAEPTPAETIIPSTLKIEEGISPEAAPAEPIAEEVAPSSVREKWKDVFIASEEPPVAEIVPPPEPEIERHWSRLERLFVENWTGILGAVVLVAGVTFIGIYTALRLTPVYRFLMTVAVAAALFGASLFLRRQEPWRALAEWVRSAGAAIFLFACAAAGGLPGLGLQWVNEPLPALGLLVTGLAVNLYIGYAGSSQSFAALHVVLSLLPLAIVPQSAVSFGVTIFIIAAFVALFGVGLAFRPRWDLHLLATVTAYVFYHVSWYVRVGSELQLPSARYTALLCAVAVFGSAILVHYRKDYASHEIEPLPLFVHLTNWVLLSVGLIVYLTRPSVRGITLVLAGVMAYILARRARSLGVRWVYRSDALIGQLLVIAGIFSFSPIVADMQILYLSLFLETLLFLHLVLVEGDDMLCEVGLVASHGAGVLLAVGGLASLPRAQIFVSPRVQSAMYLLVGAMAGLTAHIHFTRKHAERLGLRCYRESGVTDAKSVLGFIVGVIVIGALVNLMPGPWMETTSLIAVGGLLLVSRRLGPPGLANGSILALVSGHVLSWIWLLNHSPWTMNPLAMRIGPLSVLGALSIGLIRPGEFRQTAIYLLGLDVGLAAYLFLDPLSTPVPGITWLSLSLVGIKLSKRLERSVSSQTLEFGYLCLGVSGLVLGHVFSWSWLLRHMPWTVTSLAIRIGPLSSLAALSILMIEHRMIRQIAIYLLGLNAGLAAYLFFNPVSTLVPGVAWLMLSLVALEFANRLERPASTSVLGLGYVYLVAFAGAYALVVLQTQAYLGIFRVRLLIELFALAVLAYWWLFRPRESLGTLKEWVRVHPFFLEFALVLLVATILAEVSTQWRSVAWSVLALLFLSDRLTKGLDERFQLYSLIFYWISVLNVMVLMSTFETPSPYWYDRPDIMAIIAISLQIIYIILSHHRLALSGVRFPAGLGWMTSLGRWVEARRPQWVYYPFFVGVGVFLYWRFDRSVLTLLWSVEAFAVFVLSALLRENQFRYMALGALGACLVRLVLFDLAQANLGLRGLVFLGVGLLMLGMNAIYNRYRRRFE